MNLKIQVVQLKSKSTILFFLILFKIIFYSTDGFSLIDIYTSNFKYSVKKYFNKKSLSSSSSRIHLKGSRGETLSFLILKQVDLKLYKNLPVNFKLTYSENKTELPIQIYRAPLIDLEQPSYQGAEIGLYIDPLVPIVKKNFLLITPEQSQDKVLNFWIDFKIPKNIETGVQSGKFEIISVSDHKVIDSLDFELTVWPMNIPDVPSLPAYTELNPWFIELTHSTLTRTELDNLIHFYFESLSRHGFYPLKSWIKFPQLIGSEIEFQHHDILIQNTPNEIYSDWPSRAGDKFDSENAKKNYWQSVERWLNKQGSKKYLTYYIDEPTEDSLMSNLSEISKIKSWAPSLKIMVTTKPTKSLEKYIDIFVPVINQVNLYSSFNTKNEVWWYVSCMSHGCGNSENSFTPDMVIDRWDSSILSLGVLSFLHPQIKAFLYYHVNYNYQFGKKINPWKNIYHFSGNGEGSLYYPGLTNHYLLEQHLPVESVRLKLWRSAALIHQYLTWIKMKDPMYLNSLQLKNDFKSTTDWVQDSDYYYNLKNKLGERLSTIWNKK